MGTAGPSSVVESPSASHGSVRIVVRMPVSDVGLAVTVLLLLAGLWLWLRDELLTRLSLENRSVLTIDAI